MNIKSFIKSFGLNWSDLILLFFLCCGFLISFESARLTSSGSDLSLSQPFWVYILLIIGLITSTALFLLFEHLRGFRHNVAFAIALVVLLLSSLIGTYTTPHHLMMTLIGTNNNTFLIETVFNSEVMTLHYFSFFFFVVGIYLGVFVLSKRSFNKRFLIAICYLFHTFTIIVLVYSFCSDNYYVFFSKLSTSLVNIYGIKDWIPVSFFENANVYAFYIEFGIIISILGYALQKHFIHHILAFIYYVMLLLTICKAGILINTILLLCYICFYLYDSIKKRSKVGIITTVSIVGFIILCLIGGLIFYCVDELLREKISYLFSQSWTLTNRTTIWNYGLQIASSKIICGYGYGLFNAILYSSSGEFVAAHNWFISILGKGGIIYLGVYLFFLAYNILLLTKIVKKSTPLFVACTFGLLMFFLHSMLEDIYYCVGIMAIITAVTNNTTFNNESVPQLNNKKEGLPS